MSTIIVKRQSPTVFEPILTPGPFINNTHDDEPQKRNIVETEHGNMAQTE